MALLADGKTALAVGWDGTILRSGDGGQSWSDPVLPPIRGPPRVAWLLWAGGFIFLFPAFLALPPEKPAEKSIAQLLATDRPLRQGDLDASGHADQLALQIGAFLRNAQTAPPLTIAITGPWGSGKSSVLSRLRDDLIKGGQRPVWFNAWHRQGEESLFAALMQVVRREAVPSWWSRDGLDVRMRFLFSRARSGPVHWLLAVLLIAIIVGFLWAARWPTPAEALAPVHELLKTDKLAEAGLKLLVGLGWPLALLMALLLIFGALRDRLSSAGLDPGRLLAAAGRATRWRDLGVQLAFRDRFKEALTEVTVALGRRTLTILIDDLDRCQPEQIAEVLEAINFLTDTDGCFVVFGFDRPKVLAGIGLAYREIAAELAGAADTAEVRTAYAEDFLRKLIQIEVPVPRFGAAAANRLIDAASEIEAEPPVVRAWLPALAALVFVCVVGIGLLGGEKLYAIGEAAWNAAPTTTNAAPAPSPGPGPVPPQPSPTPPPGPQPEPQPQGSSHFYAGATEAPPRWVWLTLLATLGAAGLAAAVAARRPHATADDDTELFVKALHHWAVAAYEVRQSPREMKRFLNRLRFAAAGRAPDLPDDVLVGLAVLEHAGADAELADVIKNGPSGLRTAIGGRTVTDTRPNALAVFTHMYNALTPDALANKGLPPFEPTPKQVQTFLALWEGVRVEA